MKTKRGVAQVVFSYLPNQTADLGGSIWRVDRWTEPKQLRIDETVVRNEILRSIYPWSVQGQDGDLANDLRNGSDISVISPSPDGAVLVEPFPENYRCQACGRLEPTKDNDCKCGENAWRQLAFVRFHDCGKLDSPFIPRCPTHEQVRVNVPKSASTKDLKFDCPVCGQNISDGFLFIQCDCGNGTMKYNVHRAAAVYTPRSTVMVNPPTEAKAQALRSAGARTQVLQWVLRGMDEDDPLTGPKTIASITAQLIETGLPESAAHAAAVAAVEDLGGSEGEEVSSDTELPTEMADEVMEASLHLAYATAGGRVRSKDLLGPAGPLMLTRYRLAYPEAIRRAHLRDVEFLEDFPVLDAVYGYTRGQPNPGDSTLRPFRRAGGSLQIHGQLNHTEALLFHLKPDRVLRWLIAQGHHLAPTSDEQQSRVQILEAADIPRAGDIFDGQTLGTDLLRLIHSFSHRVMRRISAFCGIDRDSLSEYLVPQHLAFVVFAASRGDFVLGGLQALFEHDLDHAMNDIVLGERRCALDPGCTSHGAACVACLHVGEPSCRYFNQFLSRDTLFGPSGYLDLEGP